MEELNQVRQSRQFTLQEFTSNFPFKHIRPKQLDILRKICEAFNQGYKTIVLEAPTGFGKSPVAVAVGKTLGSSYICSATKDLQTQYARDFPFIQTVKGMSEFPCLVKDDLISSELFRCSKCGSDDQSMTECSHTTTLYGPCRQDRQGYTHDHKQCLRSGRCGGHCNFHEGCRYRTFVDDYALPSLNLTPERSQEYLEYSTNTTKSLRGWLHLANLTPDVLYQRKQKFVSCPYYDQLNKGKVAKHSIFNYANFLLLLRISQASPSALPSKELLILDEGHQIETQTVGRVSISISKRILQQYIAPYKLEQVSYGYDDSLDKWIVFLETLVKQIDDAIPDMKSEEIAQDAKDDVERINSVIENMKSNPKNWIVSNITRDSVSNKVAKLEFKPLDISSHCRKLFEKCIYNLIMSATILDVNTFCRNIGLDKEKDKVKFIQASSDFPPENRPIYPLNTAYLNYQSLQSKTTQQTIANAIDKIMSKHKDEKGIIHTTSYAQLEFIEKFLSLKNRRRLISTEQKESYNNKLRDRSGSRDQVLVEHFESTKPTVLISPSLHTGLDLKDDYARFQILVKVPYPSKGDRWTDTKRQQDPSWYNWQTALRLVQTCGRSIRSQDDWAITYVLDSAFSQFVRNNRLPNWFMEAVQGVT